MLQTSKSLIRFHSPAKALLAGCVWSFCVFIPLSSHAQDLRTIGQLARDGAPGLALKLIDGVQPDPVTNIDGWMFFEKQRIDIMRDWHQWDALIQRLQTMPPNTPPAFIQGTVLESVNANLQQARGADARVLLRKLIWHSSEKPATAQFELYRRLVVRSYLVEKNIDDAQIAMFRYQQDYGDKGVAWRLLRARILLQTGEAADAAVLLNEYTEHEAVAMRLLAQLKSSKRVPVSVLGEARKLAGDKNVNETDKARFWFVAAQAAEMMANHLTHIRVLEEGVLLSHTLPLDDEVFHINGDHLWDAYLSYAVSEGNELQLLMGDDKTWFKVAETARAKEPEKTRAFYTQIMLQGATRKGRAEASEKFTEFLLKNKSGMEILRKLFLESERFKDVSRMPNSIRYLLVDDALRLNQMDIATRLMTGLENPPEKSDPFEWALRRSRVLVLGGQHQEGVSILENLLTQADAYKKEKIDRIQQVIFDLQAVGKHNEAIELFNTIRAQPLESQAHRELLFWLADSYRSIGNQAQAAALYLQSATLIDASGMDPWGQTARFRAAEVLTEAGLPDDARRLYEGLLRVTVEPERRAMLKYKLQELWLK